MDDPRVMVALISFNSPLATVRPPIFSPVNPDNSRAMSALTFLLFKLNTLQAKIVKF